MGTLQPQGASGESKSRMARFDELVKESEARRETTELFIPTGERLEKVIEINNQARGLVTVCLSIFRAIIRASGIIGGNGTGNRLSSKC